MKKKRTTKPDSESWATAALDKPVVPKAKKRIVAERLAEISGKHGGRITPEEVLTDATDAGSPLHDMFPWDDEVAARERRLDIARSIIREVRVEVRTETRILSIPRYIRDQRQASNEQGYVETVTIKDEKSVARDSLLYEFTRAIALLERACDIADALGVGEEVTELIRRVKVIHERLAA